jgi:predicted DNA-binding protein
MKKASPERQVHVRLPAELKRAVKMFCVREGTTEQAWVRGLIEDRLTRKAPDLWPVSETSETRKEKAH